GAADFAHHQDRLGLRVVLEQVQGVDERRTDNGVAAQSDASRLAEAQIRKLPDRLVRQRAAAADDADRAGLVDVAGHDADLTLAGGDDTGAIRPNEPARLPLEELGRPRHV